VIVLRRLSVLGALIVVIALVGAGVALLEAPGVTAALGAELIAAALLVGSRVGARISTQEDDGRGPVAR
jgi:uncharacterized membrane protein